MTGVAASMYQHGMTLHNFAGIGLGKGPAIDLAQKLESISRIIRDDYKPFGG
ncbi:MAG: hypothetical protein EZS28_039021, partial [Streblomastix strix]